MARVNVYSDEGSILDGWFDPDRALLIKEDTRWNGNNSVSVHTADQFGHEGLYRTAGGRWVLNRWSQWQGAGETYEFVDDQRAKTWLLVNGSDDVIAEHFGEVEEERGPGRPAIGEPVLVRLGDELLAKIDAVAAGRGKSRAATIRDLLAAVVD